MQQSEYKLSALLAKLWTHVSLRRKGQFAVLLVLMIATAFAEVFSLGAMLPFLAVLADPQSLFENPVIRPILNFWDITSPEGMVLPITLAFCGAALMAGAMRLLQAWANTRVCFALGADLSIAVYRRTLYQPYSVHVSRNSSTIISAVSSKTENVVFGVIVPIITMATAGIILLSLMSTLLVIDPLVSSLSFVGFGLIYLGIIALNRKRINDNGNLIARESNQVVKSLQEGLGGIRDVLINGDQDTYCEAYGRAVFPLYRAQANNQFITMSPRFWIEAIGMILIAALAYWLVGQSGGFVEAFPLLGTLAFGAQRMLPAFQQVYSGWSALQAWAATLKDVLDLLEPAFPEQHASAEDALPFKGAIELRNLHFRYTSDASDVMRDVNLVVRKGSKVGFIGTTGSGKSTLLDIVMGLLQPTQGFLMVDGTTIDSKNCGAWQRNIAHVPQSIFLSDSSIEENIAFGIPAEQIDRERVKWAANQAQIAKDIEVLPKKYNTSVGERGVRLSGGQRQRIGIARALYKQADVIIFDEATSALDNETEAAVMRAIEGSQDERTVLIIAHRTTNLRNCDAIVEVDNGKVEVKGGYEDVISA